MRPIMVHTEPPEFRGNIKTGNPNLFADPNDEEEEYQFVTLPFLDGIIKTC